MLTRIARKEFWVLSTIKLTDNLRKNDGGWASWASSNKTWILPHKIRNAQIKMSGTLYDGQGGYIKIRVNYKDGTDETYTKKLEYAGGQSYSRNNHTFTTANKEILSIYMEVGQQKFGGYVEMVIEILRYEKKG